jgi:hypothetical protein
VIREENRKSRSLALLGMTVNKNWPRDENEEISQEQDNAETQRAQRLRRGNAEKRFTAAAMGKSGSRASALHSVLSVGRRHVIFESCPGVAELADAPDSKSGGRKAVWVRPPPPGP